MQNLEVEQLSLRMAVLLRKHVQKALKFLITVVSIYTASASLSCVAVTQGRP